MVLTWRKPKHSERRIGSRQKVKPMVQGTVHRPKVKQPGRPIAPHQKPRLIWYPTAQLMTARPHDAHHAWPTTLDDMGLAIPNPTIAKSATAAARSLRTTIIKPISFVGGCVGRAIWG